METGACFSKVPKLFGPISGTTIPFIYSQRRGSKPSNFAILLIFLILKACKKIRFSKRADCSLTTSFSGPKSSRDVRETGPWFDYSVSPCHAPTNPSTHQASISQREIIVLTENRGSTALKLLNACFELSTWCYVNKRWHHYFRHGIFAIYNTTHTTTRTSASTYTIRSMIES